MQAVYGDKCVDVSTIRHWVWQFKQGEVREASLFDKARLGRPVTATDESCQECFEELALENHGII
jgi:transposase